jgi:lysophospholipase L1-like esterase
MLLNNSGKLSMKILILSLSCVLFFAGGSIAQIKVACIGNSITAGTAVGANNSYPAFLQTLLGTGYTVHNDGVSGTTLLKNGDSPYWKNGMLKDVFSFLPNIITIKLGTNDTKPQNWNSYYQYFKRDYGAMIDTLNLIATHPKIWLILPVPVISTNYGIRDSALQKILIIIKQIASERGLPVIDANTPLKMFPQYFPDGVHPSAAGEDTIAHIIYRALTSTPVTVVQKIRNLTGPHSGKARILAYDGSGASAICKDLASGSRYEISVFDAKGSLCTHAIVNGPLYAKTFKQKFLDPFTGIKIITVSRLSD